jgi:hypothetical protein
MWWLTPTFQYKQWATNAEDTEASFTAEQADWSRAFLRNVYENTLCDSSLIHRKLTDAQTSGHQINYDVQAGFGYKVPQTLDVWLLEGTLAGQQRHETQTEDYQLRFPHAAAQDEETQRRFDNFPNRTQKATLQLSYQHALTGRVALSCAYLFAHTAERASSRLYALPAADIDADRSYRLSQTTNAHTFSPALSATLGRWWIQLSFPLILADADLTYHRGSLDAHKHRTTLLFEQKRNSLVEYKHNDRVWFTSVTYTTKAPDLLAMIDFTDTTQPLALTQGNPNLKNSGTLHAHSSYALTKSLQRLYLSWSLDYQHFFRAFAQGYAYVAATGVRTYRTENVDGNRLLTGDYYLSWEFGPMQMLSLKNHFVGKYRRSVELLGTDGVGYRNVVRSSNLTENLSLGLTQRGQKVSLVGNVDYARYTGAAATFTDFDALEFHYGLQGVFRFAGHWGVQTDFTVYSRRGYQDHALNTDNYVWNTRATYSLFHGDRLVHLDGYDILHNLSNVFYTVNAQGRTETLSNVLPQYVMVGVQWRFGTRGK